MLRSICVFALLIFPLAALAAPLPQARDGGMIDGRITAVDYQRNTLGVDGGSRGRLVVTVLPSTSVQGKDAAYRTIIDLKVGQHVQIFSSLVGDEVVAQIIRILP
jgi:hypothetical protein